MAHFLNNRSCNDDYYIPNPDTDKLMIIPPAMLKINKHLNNIDTQLEALYNISEPNINEEHEEPRQPFDEHEEEIIEYAKRYDLSIAEAVDYLKTCHHCGNPDIPFGWEYCNERCQDYSIEFCYDCYRKSKCKVCDNWYRHDPWRQDEEEEEAEYNPDNIIDNDLDNDDPDCYPTMEQYYDSIANNCDDDDDEQLPTTTSHCSLCDSYVYKVGVHCKSCIAYHGKNEFTNFIQFRCYDDDGNYLYDNEQEQDETTILDRQHADADEYENMCIRYAEEADEEDENNGF